MMKNKSTILSTVVCLLPIVLSVVLYARLPEQIAIHFDNAGTPDSFVPKAVAAFGLPVFSAAINLYSHFRVTQDPKNENAAVSLKTFSQWLVPLLSVVLLPATLFLSMGANIPIVLTVQALAGVVVIIFGNDLPKCKPNYTIGIKLPWTLDNEENWNKTHRFSGFVFVIGGIILLVNAFWLNLWYIVVGVIVLLAALPVLYSSLLYQKQKKAA